MNPHLAARIEAAELATLRALRSRASFKGEAIPRAALAAMLSAIRRGSSPELVAREQFADAEAALVVKAAVAPALLSSPEWAAVLASTVVSDFVASLGPTSAGAALLGLGLQLSLNEGAGVVVPGVVAAEDAAQFVAEGVPIGVTRALFSGATLKPRKVAALVVLTREMVTTTAAEAVLRDYLARSCGLALDLAVLGSEAATDERPAGLLHGVEPLAPTAGGGEAALKSDLLKLAAAVAPVAGDGIAFVGDALLPLRLALADVTLPYAVLGSAAVPSGTIMAVATGALVAALDPRPAFETSTAGIVHEDTAAAHVATFGSPTVVAAPIRSLFQTDSVGLRVTLGASWGLRAPGSVALIEGGSWAS